MSWLGAMVRLVDIPGGERIAKRKHILCGRTSSHGQRQWYVPQIAKRKHILCGRTQEAMVVAGHTTFTELLQLATYTSLCACRSTQYIWTTCYLQATVQHDSYGIVIA